MFVEKIKKIGSLCAVAATAQFHSMGHVFSKIMFAACARVVQRIHGASVCTDLYKLLRFTVLLILSREHT